MKTELSLCKKEFSGLNIKFLGVSLYDSTLIYFGFTYKPVEFIFNAGLKS